MKILFLIPPSEWKNTWWEFSEQELSFDFKKPLSISKKATENDLKCKDTRYKQAIDLNKKINKSWEYDYSISRYSWVMYNSIDYFWMTESAKKYFEDNFLIVSWMYWLLKVRDKIGNYKLPADTKGLYKFWWNKITKQLNNLDYDYVVNLLPNSYFKLIDAKKLNHKLININFLTNKDWKLKKLTHWVKVVKWEWIKNICENNILDIKNFGWEIIDKWDYIDINIVS